MKRGKGLGLSEALTQEHSNEMADGIASILGEEMQELEKRQHSILEYSSSAANQPLVNPHKNGLSIDLAKLKK